MRFWLFISFLHFYGGSLAQTFKSAAFSKTPGVYALSYMPSLILENKSKWDINVAGVQFNIFSENLNDNSLLSQIISTSTFNPSHLLKTESNRSIIKAYLTLPSVVYAIDDRSAIAFSSGLRSFIFSQVSDTGVKRILKAIQNKESVSESLSGSFTRVYSNTWLQFGLTYARSWDLGAEWNLQAGTTLSYLSGIASAHLEFADINANFSQSVANNFSAEFLFLYNNEIDDLLESGTLDINIFNKKGFSVDFGVSAKFSDRLTFGVSVMDLGKINYKRAENSSRISISNRSFDLARLESLSSFKELGDTLRSIFDESKLLNSNYSTRLPIRTILFADLMILERVGISAMSYILNPGFQEDIPELKGIWTYILAPRYEIESLKLILPLEYNDLSDFQAGLGLNWKFLVLGSDNIFTFLFADRNIKSLDLYLAFRVAL